MRLYLIAGECHAGKTTFVNCLRRHFLQEGLKVCTFQRHKGWFDLPCYWGDHYILPPKAFESQAELKAWIPAGYDVGICEFVSYSHSWNPNLPIYLSLFSDNQINEVISPERPVPERDTMKIYSKLETPLDNECTFTTDRRIHGIERLQYIDIDGEYIQPRYDYNVLLTGFIPSEYYFMFPNLEHAIESEFCERVNDYELGIIGKTDKLQNISASLPPYARIFSMYPPAYYDISGNFVDNMTYAKEHCAYGDIYYNLYEDAPSILELPHRLIINGVPPSKFVTGLRWF